MDSLSTLLRAGTSFQPPKSAEPKEQPKPTDPADPNDMTFDDANEEGMTYDAVGRQEQTALAYEAVNAINEWAETDIDDLDDGETIADRLASLFIGIVDSSKDGDLDEDEQEIIELALNTAWDYLASLGVSEDDISSLLNDWDDQVAQSVLDQVISSLPNGDDEADQAVDNFIFGEDDQDAVFDAVYRKKVVVRNGKKVRINKRISGKVRLTSKQKLAVKKMHRKSHTAKARMKRLRSMRIARRMK